MLKYRYGSFKPMGVLCLSTGLEPVSLGRSRYPIIILHRFTRRSTVITIIPSLQQDGKLVSIDNDQRLEAK